MRRFLLSLLCLAVAPALAEEKTAPVEEKKPDKVQGAHEVLPEGAKVDDLGITVPVPASYPARRYPAGHDFPTGPEIGQRLPEFTLPNHDGEMVDFHADRGGSKSIVVFYRSAVW